MKEPQTTSFWISELRQRMDCRISWIWSRIASNWTTMFSISWL